MISNLIIYFIDSMQHLQIFRSIAICPSQSIWHNKTPIFVRATPSFHGKEWYGNVTIKMEVGDEPERTSYGQLRLILKCEMQHGRTKVMKELCLVHMYEEVGFDRLVNCPILKWATNGTGSYLLIDSCRILKAIHVVPNFVTEGYFFVNVFKF